MKRKFPNLLKFSIFQAIGLPFDCLPVQPVVSQKSSFEKKAQVMKFEFPTTSQKLSSKATGHPSLSNCGPSNET